MKLVTAIIPFFIFCSCLNKQNSSITEKDKLESALYQAENIKNFEDKIFMGFQFGMSQEEVNNHFQLLLDSGKITLDYDNTYKYIYSTSNGNIKTNFSTQYYEGKLCEFILSFHEIDNKVFSSPELIMQFAQETFQKKAFDEGYSYYIDSIAGEQLYYYIKNATIVKFSSFITPYMSYMCAPLCKERDNDTNKMKRENLEKTTSDL